MDQPTSFPTGDVNQRLTNLQALLEDYEQLDQDINQLQEVLRGSQQRRQLMVRRITLLLYVALFSHILVIILTQKQVLIPLEIGDLYVSSLPLILVLIVVVLGLVLQSMSSGRVIGISMGMLRSYAEELYDEFTGLIGDILHKNSLKKAQRELEAHLKNDQSVASASERWQDVEAADREFRLLASEIRAARISIEMRKGARDPAGGAYGFALIAACLGILALLRLPEASDAPNPALSVISAFSALACYVVFRKPSTTMFYLEELLKKLGFSAQAVAETMRSRAFGLPLERETESLLEDLSSTRLNPRAAEE